MVYFLLLLLALALFFFKFGSKSIKTDIEIAATPEEVWKVFRDTKSYETWNPFMRIEGDLEEGSELNVTVTPKGGKSMSFNPRVLRSNDQELTWKGRLALPGLFDGEHTFRVHGTADGHSLFIQEEDFFGLIVALYPLAATRKGFKSMNRALRKRVMSLKKSKPV